MDAISLSEKSILDKLVHLFTQQIFIKNHHIKQIKFLLQDLYCNEEEKQVRSCQPPKIGKIFEQTIPQEDFQIASKHMKSRLFGIHSN